MKNVTLAYLAIITLLAVADTCIAQTTIVAFKSSGWKYREAHQDPTAIGNGSWKTNAYNDAAWSSGQAPLAYEDIVSSPQKPLINTWLRPAGSHSSSSLPRTHYFRKSFNVANPAAYTGYTIKTWCDDGLVVYLNNKEVLRLNMPTGTIDSLTLSSVTAPNDSVYGQITINIPSDLQTGTNIIAIEVHQSSNTSQDRYFDFSIEGIDAGGSVAEWPVAFKSAGWKYRNSYQDMVVIGNGSWKNTSYNDAAWSSGQATLAYDDSSPTHTINTWLWPQGSGRTGTNSPKTHYFRKSFNITNASSHAGYRIKGWCDDGMIVYMNGREVFRLNMPTGTIDSLTAAVIAPASDSIYKDTTVYVPGDLITGTNVVAAEVHQAGTSVDRYFDLSIEPASVSCSATLLRSPYLQIGTPTSVIIRWRTDIARNSKVKFGTSPGNLTSTVDSTTLKTEHIVKLTGLTPNTKYYYSVGYSCASTEYVLAGGDTDHYYYAMPNTTTDSLRFWILGDVCSNNPTGTSANRRQVNVRDAYMTYLGNKRLNGIIWGGDNSKLEGYDGTETALDYNFFPVYKNQLRNTVSWMSLGNHDYGPRPYIDTTIASYYAFSYPKQAEAGGIASNAKSYYSYDVGDVHFVILNPYHADPVVTRGSIPGCNPNATGWSIKDANNNIIYNGCAFSTYPMSMYLLKFTEPNDRLAIFNQLQQVKWLKTDLAATTKKWKIVLFHTPPYTKGTHNSDDISPTFPAEDGELQVMRRLLVPVLEQYKVDLIVTSHTHAYDRSYLMQGVTEMPTKAQFRANPNQLLQNWSGTYGPTSRPYIKNPPYNGAVHIVTGNAGRGASGDGSESSTARPHPVMFYSDSSTALLNKGGSVELVINQNRLDIRYLKLNSDSSMTGQYIIKDQFTIVKDVNKKITYNNPTAPLSLTASWQGNYSWKIMGGSTLPNTTQSIQISPLPAVNTTYIVNDGYNGSNGYLADTFVVIVCPPNLTLNTTISSSGVYQAAQWIKGTNTNIIAPSATVEYRAGYIELVPTSSGSAAFVASPSSGHYFLAIPGGCAGGGGSGSSNSPLNHPSAILPKNTPQVTGQTTKPLKKDEY